MSTYESSITNPKKQLEFYKDLSEQLEKENQELKRQLREASLTIQEMTERDIYCPNGCDKLEKLLKENQKLKKQLSYEKKRASYWYNVTLSNAHIIQKNKIQQKEFIKWLENGIEKVKNTEFLDERIQRAGLIAYNRCSQKYKSIIGVSDEKEN